MVLLSGVSVPNQRSSRLRFWNLMSLNARFCVAKGLSESLSGEVVDSAS